MTSGRPPAEDTPDHNPAAPLVTIDLPGEPEAPVEPAAWPAAPVGGGGRAIALAAAIIGLGNVASRLLGVGRESAISNYLGYGDAAGAFTTASRVPTMVYDLLIGGAISAALIPIFSEYAERREPAERWRLVSAVITAVVVVMGLAAGAVALLAEPLAGVLSPGRPAATVTETAALIRIVAPSLVFFAVAAVTTSALYAAQVFQYPAFAAAVYNLGVIVGAVLLTGLLGWGAAGVAAGIALGSILQVALQWPGLHRRGFRFRPILGHPDLPRIFRFYLPVAAGLVVTQLSIVLDTALANATGETSVAVMRYATTLVQLPLGLVATGISFAVLPTLSRLAPALAPDAGVEPAERAATLDRYKDTLARGITFSAILIVPMTVGLIVLREPVVRLLFERGRFDAGGTELTALAFLLYAPQLPFVPVDQLLINAFYARKDTTTPMLVGLAGVGIYLAVALALIQPLGMPGLVLANAVQNIAHTLVMWVLVHRRLGSLGGRGIGPSLLKIGAASLLMGAVVFGVAALAGPLGRAGVVGELVLVGAAAAVGAAVYAGAATMLRIEEFALLIGLVRRRLGRGRA